MKNLLNILIRYSYFLLFIILEAICFTLFFSNNTYQRSSFVNSSNSLIGRIHNTLNKVHEYTNLKSINDSLLLENTTLKNSLENYRHYFIPNIDKSGFEYISTKVINVKSNSSNNYVTLNKGSNHGIKEGMGVIATNGLVGVVVSVSNNFATVLPAINPLFKISVKIKRNNFFGSMSWTTDNIREVLISEIPEYADIKIGDDIITSGFSSIFPEGIPIGKIKSFYKDSSIGFYQITAELYTDFNCLNYAYVIKNQFKEEFINNSIENE